MKRSISPRIGILGANTFAPDGNAQRRPDAQPSNTVNKTIRSIEEQMVLGYELLAAFKQEAEVLRGEIDVLMQDLIEKVENVQDDCSPEIYKDYKELKANIATQKDEKAALEKLLSKVSLETAEQRERVEVCSERILVMEEQVGMMAHNEKYKMSVEGDELFNESMANANREPFAIDQIQEEEPTKRELYKVLNPASTTSSLEPIDNDSKGNRESQTNLP